MNQTSDSATTSARKLRWIAFGFIGAFAASVLTVIYTGLNVEGVLGEFDAGFRPVTLAVGEVRAIDLEFDSETAYPEAILEIILPEMVEFSAQSEARTAAPVAAGSNTFSVAIEAMALGRGYLIARVEAASGEPIGLYRVFVTVADD